MTATGDRLATALRDAREVNTSRLCDLVAFPTVSAAGFDREPLAQCARHLNRLLEEIGLQRVGLLSVDGSDPYVYGEHCARPGAPTLLLYAHYDVQPPGDEGRWTSEPFRAVLRDGRLYGRGTADDKAGILVHIAAIEAWLRATGSLPVNVKVLLDGEEEAGNPTLRHLLHRERSRLSADLVVVPDTMNPAVGRPAITTSTRGAISLVVEVRALDLPVHSGFWGGVVPDPLLALCRALGSLVDSDGAFVLAGEATPSAAPDPRPPHPPGFQAADVRRGAGVRPSVELWGDPATSIPERLWHLPCVTVLAVDAPAVATSGNSIQAAARARVSVRLPAGFDPEAVHEVVEAHLREAIGWGLEVRVEPGSRHAAWAQHPRGAAFSAAERAFARAYGTPVVYTGMGASIPMLHWLASALGEMPCLLTGVEDPQSRAHGIDESVHVEDWQAACLAEALLFSELAGEAAS